MVLKILGIVMLLLLKMMMMESPSVLELELIPVQVHVQKVDDWRSSAEDWCLIAVLVLLEEDEWYWSFVQH